MESDSCYSTTYSEDERIQQYLTQTRKKEAETARQLDLQREINFASYYETRKNKKNSIFNYAGLHFLHFTHTRIKFSFHACKVARLVSQRIIFYVSLRHRKGRWLLRRDSIPVNYKSRIYKLFYTNGSFRFKDDANMILGIKEIYEILVKWAQSEHRFRKDKLRRLRNGEDLYIYTDDEDLFLSASEIEELHRKRESIWARMLPPTQEPLHNFRQKRARRISRLPSETS